MDDLNQPPQSAPNVQPPVANPVQNPTPTQPPTFSAPEQPKGSKWRLILIILLILSAISFGGYYLILPKMGINILPTPTPTPTITKLPSPTSVQNQTIDTSNWKTYTNTNHNYSLKYPIDWQLNISEGDLSTNNKVTLIKDDYEITIWSNLIGIGGLSKELPSFPIKVDTLNLFERQGEDNIVEQISTLMISEQTDSPTFKYQNKTYDISFDYPLNKKGSQELKNNIDIFHQILSTFKFTNPWVSDENGHQEWYT